VAMISVGIDGGGTSIRVCVASIDSNTVLEEFTIPSGINLTSTPAMRQAALLRRIEKILVKKFGTDLSIDFVVLAVSGGGTTSRKEEFEKIAEQVFNAKRITVLSDIEALKYLLLSDKTGIVVVCGTGSIAISHRGKRVGGWGHLFGDEAGAYAIALEIFRRFFDYVDNIVDHDLVYDELMKFYHLSSSYELTNIQLRKDFKAKIATFTKYMPLTDTVKEIIDEQVDKFSKKVIGLAKSELIDDLYFFGGMFENDYFRDRMFEKLRAFNLHRVNIKTHVELALNACYLSDLISRGHT